MWTRFLQILKPIFLKSVKFSLKCRGVLAEICSKESFYRSLWFVCVAEHKVCIPVNSHGISHQVWCMTYAICLSQIFAWGTFQMWRLTYAICLLLARGTFHTASRMQFVCLTYSREAPFKYGAWRVQFVCLRYSRKAPFKYMVLDVCNLFVLGTRVRHLSLLWMSTFAITNTSWILWSSSSRVTC